jgi:hypothetical protein
VKGLQLEDRYAISAEVQFREDADGSLGARSTVVIDVDLPEPFASINKFAGPAASGVLQNMVSLFLVSSNNNDKGLMILLIRFARLRALGLYTLLHATLKLY